MTDRATLTALYLDEVARRGVRASELLSVMPKSGPMEAKYEQDYLSRPLFLGHAERDQLNQDLQQLRTALVSLPGLLYGGDLAAFARAAGMTDDQAAAVLRSRTGAVGGPYVLQRRIRPEAELCPGEDGEPVAWVTTSGVFTRPAGYGGVFARAFTADSQVEVLRAGMGAFAGCCLSTQPEPAGGA
jgi:hypothetical protein